jgi:hypothetical protein
VCARCLVRIGRRCALCRARIHFAEGALERTRDVLAEVAALPPQQPLLFPDVAAPTMPQLEAALRALCRNRAIVLRHLRLRSLARRPEALDVSARFELATLETNAWYYYALARRALGGEEPSPGLRRALREALALDWSHAETAAHVVRLLSLAADRRAAEGPPQGPAQGPAQGGAWGPRPGGVP